MVSCLPSYRPAGRLCSIGVGAVMMFLMGALPRPAAAASNEALLKLLQVLRDRGSITAQEYETVRLVAEAPDPPAEAPAPVAAPSPAPVVNRAQAAKWYERMSIRGYSQLRYTEVGSENGPGLYVPSDRSVNPNESFQLRRGRVVISGDVADHLSLYAQTDFAGSPGAGDFALQMRDLYGDVWLDEAKSYRVRVGQSKVPFGFVNLQSSSNRAAMERPDALNSAVEGERDLGAALMWENAAAKQRFRELGNARLKGSGDYGVLSAGVYSGQGLNRPDENGKPHVFVRAAYPFKTTGGHYFELGIQAYRGRFVVPTAALTSGGATFTPLQADHGTLDQRVAFTAIVYPQPFGIETEWNFGQGPQLSADHRTIGTDTLHGGYVQLSYALHNQIGTWLPFTRWQYYDGARKFGRNAPVTEVNEVDVGVEFAKWAEVELTGMYTRTIRRTRTSTFPYALTRNANRVGLQVQWNY